MNTSRPHRGRPKSGSRRSIRIPLVLVAPLLGACATPPAEPLEPDALVASIAERGVDAADLAAAMELARIGPLAIERPPRPDAFDPDADAPWRLCAYGLAPEVRRARRAVLSACAAAGSAGAPGPIGIDSEKHAFGGSGETGEVSATFDILAIFGAGRSRAAKDLARAEERRAFAALERAVWSARFVVDRARARVAAAAERRRLLDVLLEDGLRDGLRIDMLERRGRASPADAAWSRAIVSLVRERSLGAEIELADARASLAVAAGLPASHPALAGVSGATLSRFDAARRLVDAPPPRRLLDARPDLREKRLEYAVAEARLRREAAERIPTLGLGPKLFFEPDMLVAGGMLRLEVPVPGSLDGRVAAAVEERASAREAVEDALLMAEVETAARRARLVATLAVVADTATPKDAASERMWRANRAKFLADAAALEMWSFGLEHRIEPLNALVDAKRDAALAALDFEEACGPPPPPAQAPELAGAAP